jgi:hypothetical protein
MVAALCLTTALLVARCSALRDAGKQSSMKGMFSARSARALATREAVAGCKSSR